MGKDEDGKDDNHSDSSVFASFDSKKGALIVLASLGVTLLVTGATGSRLLKRKQGGVPSISASPAAPIVHRRNASQLKQLFALSSPSPSSSLDFRANNHFTTPLVQDSSPQAAASHTEDAQEDPMMGALTDAVKAFGLATFLVFGGVGLSGYILAHRVGATDLDSFLSGMRDQYLHPLSKKLEPPLPRWLKQRVLASDERVQYITEEKEVEYWLNEGWQESVKNGMREQREWEENKQSQKGQ